MNFIFKVLILMFVSSVAIACGHGMKNKTTGKAVDSEQSKVTYEEHLRYTELLDRLR